MYQDKTCDSATPCLEVDMMRSISLNPMNNESLSRDVEIHVNMIRENLPVSESKWKEMVDKTIDDETLSEVKHYICNSWSECIGECSAGARDYFNYRDELSVLGCAHQG